MSETTEVVTVHCPKCNGTNIGEWNVAYALLEVWAWEMDGDMPVPSDIDTGVDADWEVDDRRNQYQCRNITCGWEGSLDELVVKRTPAENDSDA